MENHQLNENDFFTPEEVYLIMEVVNEKLKAVYYHYWVNNASKEKLEILDYIEFQFESGRKLILASDDESEGIRPLPDYDFDAKSELLKSQHAGIIYMERKDMSKSALWKDALGRDITPSFLQHEKQHLNDNLVFHFEGSDSLEIFLGLEGLEVEVFEE
ncbi:MAG: hypothetical protein ACK4GL_11375 [Flavobacteriales bacterium]